MQGRDIYLPSIDEESEPEGKKSEGNSLKLPTYLTKISAAALVFQNHIILRGIRIVSIFLDEELRPRETV